MGTQAEVDRIFMERAMTLARKGLGTTSPNPAVGAVVVKDGVVVGEGYHQRAGLPHAEAIALELAGESARGATLYVTLEPCRHWGRTPPCVDRIISSGVSRVVVAMVDPNPKVGGNGIAALTGAGIRVEVGVLEEEALELSEAYRKHVTTGIPFVTVKYAMTLDGKVATRSGRSRWISGPESRRVVHLMRSRVDAVVVGVGTVLKDDPELSCRLWEWEAERGEAGGEPPPACNQPVRIVLDSFCRTPPSSRVVTGRVPAKMTSPWSAVNRFGAQTIIATTAAAAEERARALGEAGARVLRLEATDKEGRVPIWRLLEELGRMGMIHLLVEGGARLNAAFLEAGAVDKVVAFVAPKIFGGDSAPGPVGGTGVDRPEEAISLKDGRWETVGGDLLYTGYISPRAISPGDCSKSLTPMNPVR